MSEIFTFLKVEPITVDLSLQHQGHYRDEMSPVLIRKLTKYFEKDITRVESFLDWDCSEWLEAIPQQPRITKIFSLFTGTRQAARKIV